jgi:selenocysteine-specific elongation factor
VHVVATAGHVDHGKSMLVRARQALGTTRRTAIPLLEWLDRAGVTRRLADDRRTMREPPGSPMPNGER